jgi:hypothetical protein
MKSLSLFMLATSLLVLPLDAQESKTIHVDQLVADAASNQSTAEMVTAKLISYLTKRGVAVLEDDADAVLTGSCRIDSATRNGYTRYRVQGAMRLTDKDGKVLWGDVVYSSRFASSATSSFADNVAKEVADFLVGKPKKP